MELINAVKNNDMEEVKKLLDNPKMNINFHAYGATALIKATVDNNIAIVKELLNCKRSDELDVNIIGYHGMALFLASKNNMIDIVKELLKHPKIAINKKAKYVNTALIEACVYGHINIIRELIKNTNINVNIRNNEGFTALMFASWDDCIDISAYIYRQIKELLLVNTNTNGYSKRQYYDKRF